MAAIVVAPADVIANLPDGIFDSFPKTLLCDCCLSPSDQWVIACGNHHSFCAPCLYAHKSTREQTDGHAQCPTCRGDLVTNQFDNFEPERTKNTMTLEQQVECPQEGCTHRCSLANVKQHMLNKCMVSYVDCPYAKYGCTHACKRSDLQSHMDDDASNGHSRLVLALFGETTAAASKSHGELCELITKLVTTDVKQTIDSLSRKVNSQGETITNLNSALAAQTAATTALTGQVSTLVRKLDEVLSDGEHSLRQIAINTKKRASPGQSTNPRTVRKMNQLERQKQEIANLKGVVAPTEPSASPAAGSSYDVIVDDEEEAAAAAAAADAAESPLAQAVAANAGEPAEIRARRRRSPIIDDDDEEEENEEADAVMEG